MSRAERTIAILMLSTLIAAPGSSVAGRPLAGATAGLQAELRTLRARVDRAPRGTTYDLDRARRELLEQQLERPDDPRLQRLGQEIRDLQWRADRGLRQAARAAGGARLDPSPGALATPGALGPPVGPDLRADRLPVGTGKRFILIQNGLRVAEVELGLGRVAAAAAQVAKAKGELAALQVELGDAIAADDPNLVALQADLVALEQRTDAARRAALGP